MCLRHHVHGLRPILLSTWVGSPDLNLIEYQCDFFAREVYMYGTQYANIDDLQSFVIS